MTPCIAVCMYTFFKLSSILSRELSISVFNLLAIRYKLHLRVLLVELVTLDGLAMTQMQTKIALKRQFSGFFLFFFFASVCQVKKDFES